MSPLMVVSMLLVAAPGTSASADACVGFLEYNRLDKATVTTAFKRDGKRWERVDAAQAMHWTVAFDGKRVGELQSSPAGRFEIDADANVGVPDDPNELPAVGKSTQEFAGAHSAPVPRPLVLVSEAHYRDPQQWKVKKASAPAALLARFRKDIAHVRNCTSKSKDDPSRHAFHFTSKQVSVTKAYQANNGARLVGLQLDTRLSKCDGPQEPEWRTHWYLLPYKHDPVYLGDALVPLDAGDYDGDGQSEFIFAIQRQDETGYAMFYDGLRKHVEYTWSPN